MKSISSNQARPVQNLSYSRKNLAQFNFAVSLLESEEYEGATEILYNLINKEPKIAAAWTYLAIIFFRERDYDNCIVYAEQALDLFPQDVEAAFYLGASYHFKGRSEEALQIHKKALNFFNPDFSYLKDVVLVYGTVPPDYPKLIEMAKIAIQYFPHERLFWGLLNRAYRENGEPLYAAYIGQFFESMGFRDPKEKREAIEAYLEAGHYQEAYDNCRWYIEFMNRSKKRLDNDFRMTFAEIVHKAKTVGYQLTENRRTQTNYYEMLHPAVDFILGIVPDLVGAIMKKAEILKKKKDYQGSLEMFLQAQKYTLEQPYTRSRNNPLLIQQNIALLLYKLKRFSLALPIFEILIRENSENTWFLGLYAKFLAKTGKKKEAFKTIDKMLKITEDQHTNVYVAKVLRFLGEFEKARKHLDKALESQYVFPESLMELGKLLAKQGYEEEALEKFYQVIETNSNNEEAQLAIKKITGKLPELPAPPIFNIEIDDIGDSNHENLETPDAKQERMSILDANTIASTKKSSQPTPKKQIETPILKKPSGVASDNKVESINPDLIPTALWYKENMRATFSIAPKLENLPPEDQDYIDYLQKTLGTRFTIRSALFELSMRKKLGDLDAKELLKKWTFSGILEDFS